MIYYCTKCGKRLDESKMVLIELSETDGRYYPKGIPIGHISQGYFEFGNDCAKKPNEVSKSTFEK